MKLNLVLLILYFSFISVTQCRKEKRRSRKLNDKEDSSNSESSNSDNFNSASSTLNSNSQKNSQDAFSTDGDNSNTDNSRQGKHGLLGGGGGGGGGNLIQSLGSVISQLKDAFLGGANKKQGSLNDPFVPNSETPGGGQTEIKGPGILQSIGFCDSNHADCNFVSCLATNFKHSKMTSSIKKAGKVALDPPLRRALLDDPKILKTACDGEDMSEFMCNGFKQFLGLVERVDPPSHHVNDEPRDKRSAELPTRGSERVKTGNAQVKTLPIPPPIPVSKSVAAARQQGTQQNAPNGGSSSIKVETKPVSVSSSSASKDHSTSNSQSVSSSNANSASAAGASKSGSDKSKSASSSSSNDYDTSHAIGGGKSVSKSSSTSKSSGSGKVNDYDGASDNKGHGNKPAKSSGGGDDYYDHDHGSSPTSAPNESSGYQPVDCLAQRKADVQQQRDSPRKRG